MMCSILNCLTAQQKQKKQHKTLRYIVRQLDILGEPKYRTFIIYINLLKF